MTGKLKTKANRRDFTLVNQITSPLKPELQYVSTLLCRIKKSNTAKPWPSSSFTPIQQFFSIENQSDCFSYNTPSIAHRESSSSSSTLHQSTSGNNLIENVKNQKESKMLKCTVFKILKSPLAYIGVPKGFLFLLYTIEKITSIPTSTIIMCLKKIRLNNSFKELGDDFGMKPNHARKTFLESIPKLATAMHAFIIKLNKSYIKKHLPLAFSANYSQVSCIILCLNIQLPSKASIQAFSWNENKKTKTIKYLISCTPNGLVNYVSKGYRGKITDTYLVQSSDFVKCLKPGMCVMAYKGFKHVEKFLHRHRVQVVRPPLVTAMDKLPNSETREMKQLASLRIHIERVIQHLNFFHILKPHAWLYYGLFRLLDDIVIIACSLVNLQHSHIK